MIFRQQCPATSACCLESTYQWLTSWCLLVEALIMGISQQNPLSVWQWHDPTCCLSDCSLQWSKRHLLHSHLRSASSMNFSNSTHHVVFSWYQTHEMLESWFHNSWFHHERLRSFYCREDCLLSWYQILFMSNEICPNLMLLDLLLGFLLIQGVIEWGLGSQTRS